jgi:nucleoside-diphosphate-sugar epimerase
MRKILITGNMGYVGSVAVLHLRRAFPVAKLVGLDSAYFGACLSDGAVLPESLLDQQIFADVRDVPESLFQGVEGVVHLAGISNDPIGNAYEQATLDVNALATVDLAARAKAAGVTSFVFASSCSVYGFAEEGARDESSEVGPLTAYATSKVRAEEGLTPLADASFKVTCLRFATACGFSPRVRLDLVLNDFVACALSTGEIQILSDGTPWRPLIDVRDMALAMEWALTRGSSEPSVVVNVGREEWNYRVRELAEAVLAEVPGVTIHINQNAPADKRSYRVSFRKFESLAPRHQPRYGLPQTIRDLLLGFKNCGLQRNPDPYFQYSRLKFVSFLVKENRLDGTLRWRHENR